VKIGPLLRLRISPVGFRLAHPYKRLKLLDHEFLA
jgi:hypothetical protein